MENKQAYIKKLLPNGVRLMMIPMSGVDSVATSVMVGVGSRYETPDVNGVSHFLEHMVFKGTKKYPTTDDVNFIERLGGIQNAYTDIDITAYHNKTLSSDWISSLEINKELALFPRLEEQYVDKERDVILEEMKRYEDMPEVKAEEVYHSTLYPNSRLGMRIIGTEESLRAIASGELHKYHDYWYQPEKIVVVLAGKLENPAVIEKQLMDADWLGNIKNNPTAVMETVNPKQDKPAVVITTKPDAQQAQIVLGVRAFPRSSEDRFAWALFNLIMGSSFTSRLFKEIREKRGLCYHIHSSSSMYEEVGSWDIHAGVATEKVSEAVAATINELTRARDAGVTDDELKIARKRLATMLVFRSEDPEFFVDWYGRAEVYHLPILTVSEYIEKINKITKEDVDTLIKKYLLTNNLNLSVVWNRPMDENLINLLKI